MSSSHPEWIITPTELKACIYTVTLVDVREREEHVISHIAGCKLIPLGELQARALQELKVDEQIVVYCAHGVRSLHGLLALRQLGFQNLKSLEGGIAAWEEQNGPILTSS